MPLPETWTQMPVVGDYREITGKLLAGKVVSFTCDRVMAFNSQQRIVPGRFTATLDSDGKIPSGFTLPALDDPLLDDPTGTYTVKEHWTGGRTFSIAVSVNDTEVNMATVSPVADPQEWSSVEEAALASALGVAATEAKDAAESAADTATTKATEAAASAQAASDSADAASVSAARAAIQASRRRKLPAGFSFPAASWPWAVTISGGATLDPDFYKPETSATYYVSPTGSDSNDGLTVGAPKRGIDAAITAANAGGVAATIYVAAGIYSRGNSFNNTNPTVSLSIIATGGRVVSGMFDVLTYASVGSDTYSTTRSNVTGVLDTTQTDEHGDYVLLTKVADLAACQALAGSWAQVGTTLYVHREDGVAPVTNLTGGSTLPIIAANNFQPDTAGLTHYIEGVDFFGGASGAVVNCRNGAQICLNNCTFAYGGSADISGQETISGLMNTAVPLVVAIDCRAHHNIQDGISAHDLGAVGVKMMTVRCEGFENGYEGGHSCNGLTLHDGSIGIDIGGSYHHNYGPNVAIITAGTQLWCVGTTAGDSYGDDDSGPEDFWVDGCEMWLDTCVSDSEAALVTLNAGEISVFGFAGTGTQTGTVSSYTPWP